MLGAAKGDAAMGAGTDANIVVASPIEQVVARLSSDPRVVRHFVGRQASAIAQLLGEEIEGLGLLAVRDCEIAGGMQRGERRARLDGELIERQVVLRVVQSARQLVAPCGQGLPLPRIDQVEGYALEILLGDDKCRQRLIACVLTPSDLRLASSSDC